MYRVVEVISSSKMKTVDEHELEFVATALAREHNYWSGNMVEVVDDFGRCIRRIQSVDDRRY